MRARIGKADSRASDKKWLVINAVIMGILFTAIVCAGAYAGIKGVTGKEVYGENMKVDGVELGGLTLQEGEALLLEHQEELLAEIQIPVLYGENEHIFSAEELGISGNAHDIAGTAFSYNKQSGSLLENYTRTYDDVNLSLDIGIDEKVLAQSIKAFLEPFVVEPSNASVVFDEETRAVEFTESANGITINTDAVCSEVISRIKSGSNDPVVAEEQVLEPEYTTEWLKANTVLIAEANTQMADDENRTTNIRLAADTLNGTVIGPGEKLSLNALLGQRTEEKGYVRADAFYDGTESSNEMGGGVCQVATTLYNAALKADMSVERMRHSFPPSYVGKGLDAMLNWDDKDLVVGNKTNYPIYIGAQIIGGMLNVKLYGQPVDFEINIENTVLQEISPPAEKVVQSDEYPAGYREATQAERTGYEVEVYRNYIKNGVVVSREKISYDYYPETRRIITEGTG
ncbi:VanW family protein [Christensenellaceae bacterium OttesenSCG-928-K19]|nr:VanW family protein [Christensenellaceae bacterium OttesenSCG-928-K19]